MQEKQDINREQSKALYAQAKQYFPGGVNSPVRAFKSVYGNPLFIERGDGCRIWDADGNVFMDFCCSWGPLILGHNHPHVRQWVQKTVESGLSFGAPTRLENELAELILNHNRFMEKIRFVSSGTEAVMSAIRLARGYTGKDKIIKFEGCYHGHSDALLVKAGSGLVTFGETSSAGIPKAFANETIVLPLDNRAAVEAAFEQFRGQIAAVIIEGIPANNGLLIQEKEYMQFLREITRTNQALLIFDEVITGFRLGFEGAAGYYDVEADILTYGKIIGGGMPVGAYGGSSEIMDHISPDGSVYQAGTLSGNPVAMAAGIAQLSVLKSGIYKDLNAKACRFIKGLQAQIQEKDYPVRIFNVGSIFWIAFTRQEVIRAASDIDPQSMELYKQFHRALLNRGVYFGPSGYEVGFISEAHDDVALQKAAAAILESLEVALKA